MDLQWIQAHGAARSIGWWGFETYDFGLAGAGSTYENGTRTAFAQQFSGSSETGGYPSGCKHQMKYLLGRRRFAMGPFLSFRSLIAGCLAVQLAASAPAQQTTTTQDAPMQAPALTVRSDS